MCYWCKQLRINKIQYYNDNNTLYIGSNKQLL